MLQTRLESSD